jgi:hypothetical protein
LIHGGTISSGRLEHVRGARRVLQQLHHVVLEDDLARRGGDVLAQLEGRGVGHLDAQAAAAVFDVAQQVVEALDEVLAVALDRLAEDFRVGQREVGRGQRVDVLAGVEVDLLLGLVVQAVDAGHGVVDVTGGDQVGLLDEVEQEVLLPFFVLEALVALVGGGHRSAGRHAGEAHHRVLPQREVVPHQVHLGLGQAIGVGQQLAHHVHEGLGDAEFVGGGGDALLDLLLDVVGQQLGGPLCDFSVGLGDFFGVRQFGFCDFFFGRSHCWALLVSCF